MSEPGAKWTKGVLALLILVAAAGPSCAFASTYVWTDRSSAGSRDWDFIASALNGQTLAAAVHGGDIFISTTTGATWVDDTAGGYQTWQSVAMSADGTIIGGSDEGTGNVFLSTNSGGSWGNVTPGGASGIWSPMLISSEGSVIAIADAYPGYIYLSTTTAASWTQETSAGSREWSALASNENASVIAAAASGGDIYISTTTGATWTDETSAGSRDWYSLASDQAGNVLIAGSINGDVYVSTTSGATWTAESSAGSRMWSSVASNQDGSILAAAAAGGDLYISTNGGSTWTAQTSAGSRDWQSIVISPDGTTLAADIFTGDIWTAALDNPSISISAPTSGATVSGSSVTLSASASDSATSIATVSFYIDSTLIGTTTGSTITWNSTTVANAAHTIYAVAKSSDGTYATSSSVSFTVNNVAPTQTPAPTPVSAGLPWCSGPLAPGWNTNLPNGGCGGNAMLGTPILPQAPASAASTSLGSEPQPADATSTASVYQFTRYLRKGMSGVDVLELQERLTALGEYSGPATGYFGNLTLAAVEIFQRDHGIAQVGSVGPLTRSALNR